VAHRSSLRRLGPIWKWWAQRACWFPQTTPSLGEMRVFTFFATQASENRWQPKGWNAQHARRGMTVLKRHFQSIDERCTVKLQLMIEQRLFGIAVQRVNQQH
jgi:hypothetical protein